MTPALILAALDGIIELIQFITKAKEDSEQNTEWTAEQKAAFQAKIDAIGTKPQDIDTGK